MGPTVTRLVQDPLIPSCNTPQELTIHRNVNPSWTLDKEEAVKLRNFDKDPKMYFYLNVLSPGFTTPFYLTYGNIQHCVYVGVMLEISHITF